MTTVFNRFPATAGDLLLEIPVYGRKLYPLDFPLLPSGALSEHSETPDNLTPTIADQRRAAGMAVARTIDQQPWHPLVVAL
jgi:hypothetical protein